MKLAQIYRNLLEFDYSKLKTNVYSFINDIKKSQNNLLGQNLTNLAIEDILNDIGSDYGISFKYESGYPDDIDFQEVGINGARAYTSGKVVIFYTEDFYKTFDYDDEGLFNRFLSMLKLMIVHELTHVQQVSKMRVEPNGTLRISDKEYYSNKQEIMAHANEAIQHFIEEGYNKDQILKLLKNPGDMTNNPRPQESHAFFTYYDWFYKHDDVIWKRFVKYCYQYLDKFG